MNNTRRKSIQNVISRIEELKEDLETILDDEQEYLDNMPENLQESSRAETAQEAIDNMEMVVNSLDECIDTLGEVC